MKKLNYSPFTSGLTRALKNSKSSLYCCTESDGYIYICDGHWLVKLSPEEYDVFARPVTQRDAGNWALYATGVLDTTRQMPDLMKIMSNAVSAARYDIAAAPMEFEAPKGKGKLTGYYSEAGKFVTVFNSDYSAMFNSSFVKYRSGGDCSGAVVYYGDEPVAFVLPVNVRDSAIPRTVRAWFISDNSQATQQAEDEINRLRHESAVQAKAIELLRERIAELEATTVDEQELSTETALCIVEQPAESADDEQEPEQESSKIDTLVKQLSALPSVEVTVKGAQTAAPVVWISGDTKPVKEEIKELGGRWSNKRNAWYIKVA